ncbi:hypothetical protein JYU34_016314 [Plutella xylostella]|uniref:Reverse transcriptase domain-containing protein n=1 Tax=Plutella xylostella TaxID=51655 RepID=A0ABQ7Q3S0_PLUXY|nr:hypothetical protein JYU34_016314 [Plutella xylostella]
MTNKISYMCSQRNKLLKIWKEDESILKNRLLYNIYRNKTNKYINKVKNNYYKKEIDKNFKNPKKQWEIINKLCGKVIKSIDEIIINSFKNIDTLNLVNNFAIEFQNNVKKICCYCDKPLLNAQSYSNQPDITMRLKKANNDIIFSIIRHMNDKKSPGIDGIRMKDLKCINSQITPLITHLINSCIVYSQFPDKLKVGCIRPVYKKGAKNEINNYRPITILPCIEKIIERYLGNELNKFIITNQIINKKQFGFQKHKNTSQLLSQFTNEINQHMNDRCHVLAIFIDFSKAFETLNYTTLFSKLQQNGIQGPFLDLLKNYHTNRFTVVNINGAYSQKIPTEEGVAQGSITGPTEYLLYVNDMSNIFTEGTVYQFADDTCLITAHKDISIAQIQLQHNYNQLCKWAHDVGLIINAQKTKLLHIHSPHLHTTFTPHISSHTHQCFHSDSYNATCNCDRLELVKQHTYLGLIIDKNFSWKPHIEHLSNKLRALMSRLQILKFKLPFNILRTLYLSLADSIISYC